MPDEYKYNHYVPQWYQKKFIPNEQTDKRLFYLDLKPRQFRDTKGHIHTDKAVRKLSPSRCFGRNDLYTRRFGSQIMRDIEKIFFGAIDTKGKMGLEYFETYDHTRIDYDALHYMMLYMSTQKLRTPKGLDWLANITQSNNVQVVLNRMMEYRNLFSAIWLECIWQIADASSSPTKFIISDHPVTVYNRECGPRNPKWCRGPMDPDIRLVGTHTIFPLSLDKILILTNLSWARNPYQRATNVRPNPKMLRGAVFKYMDIQIQRMLTEQEVREINFIIKSRAYENIAAAEEEWLYPEHYVSKSNWNTFGNGYLLMPDPRPLHYGGQVIMGYNDGSAAAFDEYGRRPWEEGYNDPDQSPSSENSLYRFKGEFARLYGPERRGRSIQGGSLDAAVDTQKFHEYHLSLDAKSKKHK